MVASVMGLGCGGHSRLGLSHGATDEQAADVVRAALDLGINFIDTAESYKTEPAVGAGIRGVPRHLVYISTKAGVGISWDERWCTGPEMRERVHNCLNRLQTDYIDLFNLHGVSVEEYAYGRDELVPTLLDLKAEGKIRHIGITEQFINDPKHEMLDLALEDDCWEVVMVGFNILNQSARHKVLPRTMAKGIGTLEMFAVRRALSKPEALREAMTDLVRRGLVEEASFDGDAPLAFMTENGIAEVRENVASLQRGPLPDDVQRRARNLFAKVDDVSGN
jgi:aryl-alcohol dehydrogenase-like predicted oxidoreductase